MVNELELLLDETDGDEDALFEFLSSSNSLADIKCIESSVTDNSE